jgi:hypothetical protein
MLRKHKTEPEIRDISSRHVQEQNAFFDRKRREGIYEFNFVLMAENEQPTMREKKVKSKDDKLRVCSGCKSYLSSRYFFKHRCGSEKESALKPKLLQSSTTRMDRDEGFKDILNRFRDGVIGDICRTNSTIKMIGYRHYNLRRHEISKQNEVRKVVMAEMRELSKLYVTFKDISGSHKSVESMFTRDNLQDLVEAVQQSVTVKNDDQERGEKHGQKLLLDAIILRSIKSLHGFYMETVQDAKGKELKNFKAAYKYRSNELYPRARQSCVKNSMEKLRRPSHLPNEEDLKLLKAYLQAEIVETVKNFSMEMYTWLRTIIVSRLTLFNARRGEEASRMLCKEWEDGEKNIWMPAEHVEKVEDPAEKLLVGQFKLVYLKGKGKKFVPVLIPIDLVPGLQLLVKMRSKFGISDKNMFLFATKSSASHCSGWHALNDVCTKAGIKIPVTAGKMRHRLSTVYATLHMDERNRKLFLDHMGHDLDVNKDNYQCPQGIRAITVMGKMLRNMEEGM